MYAAIYLPCFALQAVLRNEPESFLRPVVLIDGEEKKPSVIQLNKLARETGICEGLTPTQALARCSNVIIKSRSLSNEKTATGILLQTAYNFSPRIEATADGICTMDLQGLPCCAATHTASGLQEAPLQVWAENIRKALAQLNLRAQIGLAKTPSIALHAARCANPILLIEHSAQFISELPIQSLEPAPHILDILHRWGIRTVEDFTALGKDKIAERLGPEALELFDRASTEEIRPLNLITPSEHFSETMDFDTEIESLQPLLFILHRFVEQLSRRISLLHLVISDLNLELNLASGEKYKSHFKVPSPTANVEILFRMLQTHLENVRTDTGIVALELSANPTRSENFQFGLFEASLRDPNQFAETLARLSALCGNENVGSPVLENSFRPDAFRMEPPRFDGSDASLNSQNAAFKKAFSQNLCLRRFRPAFHADVEMKDGRPTFISSLKLSSAIENVSGPFRSSGEWWEQERIWIRDEWDIQTRDGALYRIYHANNDWFIEGVYD